MKKPIEFSARTVPLALLAVILLSFALLIPWLGFYWDDWPTVWYLHTIGSEGLRGVFQVDRPLLGWIFWITSRIGGESPYLWQALSLITRWTSALAFWSLLRLVWPRHPRPAAWAALFFAVYPGFGQQYISVTYSSAWIILTAFLASLALMVLAVRKPGRFWLLNAAALLLAAFAMFSTEYFFGLELLRPVLLWIALRDQRPAESWKLRLRRILLNWLPYLALMLAFLYWRLVMHTTPRGEVQIFELLEEGPLVALRYLLQRVLGDTLLGGVMAWMQTFDLRRLPDSGIAAPLAVLVALLAAGLLFLFLARLRTGTGTDEERSPQRRWAVQALPVALLALLAGGVPFWMTFLPVTLDFPWDRFTLAAMFGSSLLLAAVLELLRPWRLRLALAAVLVGAAAGFHVTGANQYRMDWNAQEEYFWQLTWRAPAIEPGTVLITAQLPFRYFSDNSLTAPLNWIYGEDAPAGELSYLLYDAEARLGNGLEGFEEGFEVFESYRSTPFTGTTSQALVVYYEPPACVRIADPEIDARMPQKPLFYSDALPLSDLDRIHSVEPGARLPEPIYDPEPEHGWCYYYEKADLARQLEDWREVVRLAETAFSLDTSLQAINAPELIPYIEGYARTGDWERAAGLSLQAIELNKRMNRMLCDNWQRILEDTPGSPQGEAAFEAIQAEVTCE